MNKENINCGISIAESIGKFQIRFAHKVTIREIIEKHYIESTTTSGLDYLVLPTLLKIYTYLYKDDEATFNKHYVFEQNRLSTLSLLENEVYQKAFSKFFKEKIETYNPTFNYTIENYNANYEAFCHDLFITYMAQEFLTMLFETTKVKNIIFSGLKNALSKNN